MAAVQGTAAFFGLAAKEEAGNEFTFPALM